MKSMQELVKVSDVAASMRDMSREMMKVSIGLLCDIIMKKELYN